jgi:aspartate kinase
MGIIVQKYGGKCLATVDDIQRIAAQVAVRRNDGHAMVVVVSAMGQTTDELIRKAYEISPRPNRRELDMLLTTGERVSMTLLSMALNDIGVSAISFTGSQAGVFTDNSHSQARIINIQPPRVLEALKTNRVVVLAGFQGVSPSTKEVTTLGRGGSDTTAVAMAGFLKADRCEILKDVDGVYSADPKLVSNSRMYRHLPLRTLRSMCFWGAKVLHVRAADLANKLELPLFIGSALDPQQGTLLHKESSMYEQQTVIAVTSHTHVANVSMTSATVSEALRRLNDLLNSESLPLPAVLTAQIQGSLCDLLLTNDEEALQSVVNLGLQKGLFQKPSTILSSVTMTGFGFQTGSFVSTTLDKLEKQGLHVQRTLLNPESWTVFVAPSQRDAVVRSLHELVTSA